MTKTEIIKTVVGSMAAVGSGAIAAAYISNAPYARSFKPLMKACIWVGGFALEGIVSNLSVQYTDDIIDSIAKATKNIGISVTVEPKEEEHDVDTTDEFI